MILACICDVLNSILDTTRFLTFQSKNREPPYSIYCHDTHANVEARIGMASVLKTYTPPFWARYPYIQSLLGDHIGRSYNYNDIYKRSYVTTDDNQLLVLDSINHKEKNPRAILLITHGISGSSEFKYMARWESVCKNNKFIGVIYTRRGHSINFKLNNKAKRFPAHVDKIDCKLVVDAVRKAYPKDVPIFAIGHSAGGPHFAQYAGAFPDKSQHMLSGLVLLSCAIDFVACKDYYEKNSRHGQSINRYLYSILKPIYEKNDMLVPANISTLTALDTYASVHIHGYKSIIEYYENVQPVRWLPNIDIPTLYLASEDDPFVCPSSIECMKHLAHRNPYIMTVVTKSGGHLGWVNQRMKPIYYDIVATWINKHI